MREETIKSAEWKESLALPKLGKARVLTFAAVGNGLELYDYVLYGIMLPFISPYFFPSDNPFISLLIGYCTFAISFLIAPIGSIFWGWYSDKFGKINMLKLSMVLMAIPSLGIAVLPTYQSIGMLAPIILIILRLIQGISASGEVIGAKLWSMDLLGKKHYGICSGIISATGALGVMLGLLMAYITTTQIKTHAEFWRVPFLLGTALFLVARGIRKLLITEGETKKLDDINITQIFQIIAKDRIPSMIVILLGAFLGIFSYFLHAFINQFLIKNGIDSNLVYRYSIYGLASTAICSIIAGVLIDRYNKLLEMTYTTLILGALFSVPLFSMLLTGAMIPYIILGGLLGAYACSSAIIMYRAFGLETRWRGVMFCYALGCAIFGGLTPMLMEMVGQVYTLMPAILLSVSSGISLIMLRSGMKNTKMF